MSQKKAVDGVFPVWIHELHLKYGPVVRHAPDELSFIDPAAWKDVYGHRASNFQKSKVFYGPDPYGNPSGMIRAENASHGQQRKVVSHAFSDRALREQEDLLKQYTDLLVKRLTTKQEEQGKVDMVRFYNFTTFDIMADLTFGEPLRLLEDSRYTPWVAALFGNVKMVTFTAIIRRWPLIESILLRNLPAKIQAQRRQHILFSSERVDKRLQTETERPDIWTYILKHSKVDANGETNGLLPHQMHSNASTFMLAGTETTATLLSGLTYFLLQHPEKLARLQKEVRGAFSSLDDVSMTTLSQLEYLHACIEEGLRVYPPVPGHLPRLTPNGGANIGGRYVPGGVCWGFRHCNPWFVVANAFDSFTSRWLNMRRITRQRTSKTRMLSCQSAGCPKVRRNMDPITGKSCSRSRLGRETAWARSEFSLRYCNEKAFANKA